MKWWWATAPYHSIQMSKRLNNGQPHKKIPKKCREAINFLITIYK